MSLNVSGLNNYNTGIVTGTELERVSREIFGQAQVKAPSVSELGQSSQVNQLTSSLDLNKINVVERGTEIDVTRQVSQQKTDFNLQISQTALNNINALNAFAAAQNAQTITKAVDGKIFVPVEAKTEAQKADMFNALAMPVETRSSNNIFKDKRGSSFSFSSFSGQSSESNKEVEVANTQAPTVSLFRSKMVYNSGKLSEFSLMA